MPHDPVTGRKLRGRPSNAERLARPDIFTPVSPVASDVEEEVLHLAMRIQAARRPAAEKARFIALSGQTVAMLDGLLRQQAGGCAICGNSGLGEEERHGLIPDIDARGRIPGLLCPACHAALHLFQRDFTWMDRARAYLDEGHQHDAPRG